MKEVILCDLVGTLRSDYGNVLENVAEKNRLRILYNFSAMISISPITLKKGILVEPEERGPQPSSDTDARI